MKQKIIIIIAFLSIFLVSRAETLKDGIDYCKAGCYEDAIATLEKSIDIPDTDKGTAYYYLGLAELGEKDMLKAQSALSKSIENAYGSSVVSLLASGTLALLNSDSKGAEGYFKKAEKQDKASPYVLREIARVYVMIDPFKYSKEIEQCVAKCQKKLSDSGWWAAGLIQGDLTRKIGDAAAKYELASHYAGNKDFEAVAKYARLFENVNPSYSIDAYQRFIQDNPSSSYLAEVLLKRLQERQNTK